MSAILNSRTFMVCSTEPPLPLGTAFSLRPGHVMTAAHVVADQDPANMLILGAHVPPFGVHEVMAHEHADVAILRTEQRDRLSYYRIARPPQHGHHILGTMVEAYGFPVVGTEKRIPGRLMGGRIQCLLDWRRAGYRYDACELSFPAFHNLSGSPAFYCPSVRDSVFAVVTESASYSSESKGGHVAASWTIAADLLPLRGWIDEIISQA